MIELKVEDYCHNCPMFKPIRNDVTDYELKETGRCVRSLVKCEHSKICEGIARHIRNELNKKNETESDV